MGLIGENGRGPHEAQIKQTALLPNGVVIHKKGAAPAITEWAACAHQVSIIRGSISRPTPEYIGKRKQIRLVDEPLLFEIRGGFLFRL
jgi:hypothetical protein